MKNCLLFSVAKEKLNFHLRGVLAVDTNVLLEDLPAVHRRGPAVFPGDDGRDGAAAGERRGGRLGAVLTGGPRLPAALPAAAGVEAAVGAVGAEVVTADLRQDPGVLVIPPGVAAAAITHYKKSDFRMQ